MRRPYPTRTPPCGPGPGALAHRRGVFTFGAPQCGARLRGKKATLLYSSDADHVGDVAVVDAPITEGDTDATSTR